jgi:hypothetical protein
MVFFSVLAQVTTGRSPNDEEEVESRTKKVMSAEEILIAEMTTGMLDRERVRTPTAEEARAMGELGLHTLVPGSGAEDESGPAFDDSVGDEDDIIVAGVKVRNVTKIKLNQLALENVQLRGENRMEEMNIGQVRFCHKCRRKREI